MVSFTRRTTVFAAGGGIFGAWLASKTQLYFPEPVLNAALGAVTGPLPGPRSAELLARQEQRESNARVYGRHFPIAVHDASGSFLRDVDGPQLVTPVAGPRLQHADGVRRAAEAGYDGIELHAAHGYMFLGSFLAPQRNRRTDEYRGDSVKGRVRVVLETLGAIRSEIGDALPITLRISGYQRVAGGRPMFETAQVATQLVAAGVDAFHVSGGVIDRLVTGMVNSADDGDALAPAVTCRARRASAARAARA